MLSSLFVSNFRSILELKLDFTYAEGKAPNGYQGREILPFLEAGKLRLIPCLAFFGANASGKSNVLKAMGRVLQMVLLGLPPNEAFEPNLLNPKFADTTFELEFLIGTERFVFKVVYNGAEILDESLCKDGKVLYSVQRLQREFSRQIVSASYPEEKLADILKVECSDGQGRQIRTFLHRIGLNYSGLHVDLKNAFDFFKDRLRFNGNEGNVLLPVAVEILASTLNGDEKAALQEITDVVRRLDIDIAAIDITKTDLGPTENRMGLLRIHQATGVRQAIQINTSHKDVEGRLTLLDFIKHESAGTQRLAGLVGLILHALKTGGVLLIDELECSLHPLLLREILLMFKKRRHNPNGAQLIVTTHNTDILDDSILRVSEIALVKKTTANGTLVRRLVDAKNDGEDIRNVTNFRRQYLAGFYSSVPHPAL